MQNYQSSLNLPRPDFPPKTPRVVMVTGATSGIGEATARLLMSLGHHVVALGRRSERLQALQKTTEHMVGKLLTVQADVRNQEEVLSSIGQTLAQFGRLDVLVANAGLGHRGQLVDAPWEDLQTVIDTNVIGVLHTIRACVPAMRASGGGHIIMISSVLGAVPAPYSAVYCASKAAIDSLSQSLRGELRDDHIWITNFQVGQTHTEFAEKRLGRTGKVAGKVPTMMPERVALQIVRSFERRKRTVILRPFDRLFVIGGRFFPRMMDRLLMRVYR